ncbi:hypothetical protein VTH82DRAFT_2460 [Thermothelomyces myriococcoides]
MAWTTES